MTKHLLKKSLALLLFTLFAFGGQAAPITYTAPDYPAAAYPDDTRAEEDAAIARWSTNTWPLIPAAAAAATAGAAGVDVDLVINYQGSGIASVTHIANGLTKAFNDAKDNDVAPTPGTLRKYNITLHLKADKINLDGFSDDATTGIVAMLQNFGRTGSALSGTTVAGIVFDGANTAGETAEVIIPAGDINLTAAAGYTIAGKVKFITTAGNVNVKTALTVASGGNLIIQ